MYYALIMLSVVMFSGCFALKENYGKRQGSGIKQSMVFLLISSVAGLVVMVIFGGFKLSYTHFTGIMALLSSLNALGFTLCSFKALNTINLSVFSLYSMLGGMLLPFLQGVIFYGEELTVAKVLCLLFIAASLILTIQKGTGKGGAIYYTGVFILNGMSGVISKIFASAPYPKTNAAGFMILSTIFNALIAAVIILILNKTKTNKQTPVTITLGALSGSLNRIANYILVFALTFVDASVQYPLVTGGTIIVSTVICFIRGVKPSKKELASVVLAFLGMVILFAFPV